MAEWEEAAKAWLRWEKAVARLSLAEAREREPDGRRLAAEVVKLLPPDHPEGRKWAERAGKPIKL